MSQRKYKSDASTANKILQGISLSKKQKSQALESILNEIKDVKTATKDLDDALLRCEHEFIEKANLDAQLNERCKQLSAANEKYDQQLSDDAIKLQQLQNVSRGFEEYMSEIEQSNSNVLQDSKRMTSQLSNALVTHNEEHETLKRQIVTTEKSRAVNVNEKSNIIEQLMKKKEVFKQTCPELKLELQQKAQENELFFNQVQQAKTANEDIMDAKKQLKDQLEAGEKEYEKLQTALCEENNQLTSLKNKISATQAQLDSSSQSIKNLYDRLLLSDNLKKDYLNTLNMRIRANDASDFQQASKDIDVLKLQIAQKYDQCDELKKDLLQTSKLFEQKSNTLKAAQDCINLNKENISADDINEAREKLKSVLQKIETKEATTEIHLGSLEAEHTAIEMKIKETKNQQMISNATYKMELEVQMKKLKDKQKRYETLQARYKSLSAECSVLRQINKPNEVVSTSRQDSACDSEISSSQSSVLYRHGVPVLKARQNRDEK